MKTVKPCLVAALAGVLCLAGTALAAGQPAPQRPAGPQVTAQAQDAIQKMLLAYASRKDYAATFTLATAREIGERKEDLSVTGTVRFARPQKVYVELISGDVRFSITCNGQQCMAYFSASRKYLDWKAPDNLDSVLGNPALGQALGDMVRVTLIPFSSDPYKNFMIGVSAAEVVSGGGKGVHVRLDVASGGMDIYLDPKTYLVTEAHAVPTRLIEAIKAQNPTLDPVKISYDLKQQAVGSGEPVPAEAFNVTPPQGAAAASTLVDLFQLPALEEMVDFQLPSLTEGKTVKLSDLKGKVIVLDFWATWCPPCQAELPVLQAIAGQYADQGLVLLAVNQREDRQTVADYLRKTNLNIPVVLDEDGKVGDTYRVEALPTLYVIGRDGKVARHFEGFDPDHESDLRDAIAQVVAAGAAPAAGPSPAAESGAP